MRLSYWKTMIRCRKMKQKGPWQNILAHRAVGSKYRNNINQNGMVPLAGLSSIKETKKKFLLNKKKRLTKRPKKETLFDL